MDLSFIRYSLLPIKRRLEFSLKNYLFSWGETSKIIPPIVYESELIKNYREGLEFVLDFVLSVFEKGLKSVVSM